MPTSPCDDGYDNGTRPKLDIYLLFGLFSSIITYASLFLSTGLHQCIWCKHMCFLVINLIYLIFLLDNLPNYFLIAKFPFVSLPRYLFTKEAKKQRTKRRRALHNRKSVYVFAKEYPVMLVSEQATMGITLYQNHAEQLLKDYVLADSFIPCTSIIGGIFASKVVYDLTQTISAIYFKSYASLSKMQRVEWNNRC